MATNKFLTFIGNAKQLVTAIATSAGVGDANKIVATGGDGKLDLTLMPTGIGPSTETIAASENLAAGDFINIWNDSGTRRTRKADASNSRPAHGFVLAAVTSGANATIYLQGVNTGLTSLTPGLQYYLAGTAGTATATAPSTGLIQPLGIAVSATAINFEFEPPVTIA
jgi:hypothetical protein